MPEYLNEIMKRRSTPGMFIFDVREKAWAMNWKAVRLSSFLSGEDGRNAAGALVVPYEVVNLCSTVLHAAEPRNNTDEDSVYRVIRNGGGTHFSLRAFLLCPARQNDEQGSVVVVVEQIIDHHLFDPEAVRKRFRLSRRETDVLQLLYEGLSNKAISEKIFISEYTVKDHIKKIMKAMKVTSRTQVIAKINSLL